MITQGADPTVVAIRGEAQLTSVNGASWMFHLVSCVLSGCLTGGTVTYVFFWKKEI